MGKVANEIDYSSVVAQLIDLHIQRVAKYTTELASYSVTKARTYLRTIYKQYLRDVQSHYSHVKTFLSRDEPIPLRSFYVPMSVKHKATHIHNAVLSDVENASPRTIITGGAGSGKSTLMRHLFLDALYTGTRVPVFIELRSLNGQTKPSIKAAIASTLSRHGLAIDKPHFLACLKAGHFAIFLDGFDEIDDNLREKVARELQELGRRYGGNLFIVSSRPDSLFSEWHHFTVLKMLPLSKLQALSVVKNLPFEPEVTTKFSERLKSSLYSKHSDFLSNPLLLSIMALTYSENADVPQKLSLFYNQAYEALYLRHDARKGVYKRGHKCPLDLQDFANVLSAFSVLSYDQGQAEFSQGEALRVLASAKDATGLDFIEDDYLDDLKRAVCILVQDGLKFVFAHRTFQEYFAATFLCHATPDIRKYMLKKFSSRLNRDAVFSLLFELKKEIVEKEFLIPELLKRRRAIGYKGGPITMEHFKAHISKSFRVFECTGNGQFELYGYHHKGDDVGWGVVVFCLNRYNWTKEGDKPLWTKETLSTFCRDVILPRGSRSIVTESLDADDPFFAGLAEGARMWSMRGLEAILRLPEKLQEEHRKKETTLAKLIRKN